MEETKFDRAERSLDTVIETDAAVRKTDPLIWLTIPRFDQPP